MKKFSLLKISVFSIFWLMFFVLTSQAQEKQPVIEKIDNSPNLVKVLKKDGWDIPKINPSELFKSEITYFQNTPVVLNGYKLHKSFDTKVDFYALDNDTAIIKESQVIEVKTIGTFSFGGKIFAYSIVGSPFGYLPDGDRSGIGIIYRVFYFDEDGDGKFETRYTTPTIPTIIPNWLINSK